MYVTYCQHHVQNHQNKVLPFFWIKTSYWRIFYYLWRKLMGKYWKSVLSLLRSIAYERQNWSHRPKCCFSTCCILHTYCFSFDCEVADTSVCSKYFLQGVRGSFRGSRCSFPNSAPTMSQRLHISFVFLCLRKCFSGPACCQWFWGIALLLSIDAHRWREIGLPEHWIRSQGLRERDSHSNLLVLGSEKKWAEYTYTKTQDERIDPIHNASCLPKNSINDA